MPRTSVSRALAAIVSAGACALAAEPETPIETDLREEVIVTAPRTIEPLVVVNDPRRPQQPVPASDGATFLGNIPGISVARKGGSGGDPYLRGLGGSRLNVLLDGQTVLGGCGMRMDPPTAYVYPETFDRVVVVKGPQTVTLGNGNLAGVVLFERANERPPDVRVRGFATALAGGFGRRDAVGSATVAGPLAYARFDAVRARSNDYADGDGRAVHSRFERWSLNGAVGVTPSEDARLELSVDRSNGEAAYADRALDGTTFDRTGLALRWEQRNPFAGAERLELRASWNEVDHVMDNFSLRAPGPVLTVKNPARTSTGGKLALTLAPGARARVTLGADAQQNVHTARAASGPNPVDWRTLPRLQDVRSTIVGAFAEAALDVAGRGRVVGGVRVDRSRAGNMRPTAQNPVRERNETLAGGFFRYEHRPSGAPATFYAGIGRALRPADYWERTTYNGFGLRAEAETQLDVGALYDGRAVRASVSAFAARVDDYVLVGVRQSSPAVNVARNVDAERVGAEVDVEVRLAGAWTAHGSASWVRGRNATDRVPLAQTPPPEARAGLRFAGRRWNGGVLVRAVARQDRYDVRRDAGGIVTTYGTVVGQDIGPSAGFATVALNCGWRPRDGVLLGAGIDNVLDRAYAEFISRAGAITAGYAQTTRVNEPGRTAWMKLTFEFE